MNDYLYKAIARLRDLERRLIRFLGGLSIRDSEYDFVYRQVVGKNANVLDVGGNGSLLPLQLAKRGHTVTVYDFRGYPERHPNLTSIQGDFLGNRFQDNSFDFVVMVSTIEHIGFGSYGAPIMTDGDFSAFSEAKRVLKENGRIILTVPFASKEHIVPGFERWYDIARVKQLFNGMHVLAEEYYVPQKMMFSRVFKLAPASLEQITSVDDVVQTFGYQCNACYVASPIPRPNFET